MAYSYIKPQCKQKTDFALLIIIFITFIGREIFVGLSDRTNMQGAHAVGRTFPEYPTTVVKVHPPAIHLKDYISMAGPEIMAIGKSEGAKKTFQVRTSPVEHLPPY